MKVLLEETTTYVQLQKAYTELLQAYEQEQAEHRQLRDAYEEQQIMVRHQQKMVAMVKSLYGEQVTAAATDPVTRLSNHRAAVSRIDEELVRCQRDPSSFAVLFIDLDHFKHVNDTWGHRAGDTILYEVGRRLQTTLRAEDFVGRYGGEEFAVVLPGVQVHEASQIAERLRAVIAEQPYSWEIEETQTIVPIPITISSGVALYGLHGSTREGLIEHADQAMYQAKHSGRNRVCIAENAVV